MKNSMQLKAIIKKVSKEKKVSAQLVLQNYMMERLLERISLSRYKENFILKGGFLIAAMVGLDTRATMDMDATIKRFPLNEQKAKEMFEEICRIEVSDDITFEFKHIEEIREADEYTGFRIAFTANYETMAVPLKMDITTGDAITPEEITFSYPLMFEERGIHVLAYNPETILAEKLETVLSRSDQNTRLRDYYDIYILNKLWYEKIDFTKLKSALEATVIKRGSVEIAREYLKVMMVVNESEVMNTRWIKYRKDFAYASEIDFIDVCNAVMDIMEKIEW